MTDDTTTHADIEPETEEAAIEAHEEEEADTEEVEATEEAEEEDPDAETDDESEEEDEEESDGELETIEFNGKQYQVPKDLKAGFMMQADYTRKTQEVAETKRELEHRAQQIAQQAQASEEEMSARVNLAMIDRQMSQYQQMTPQDWRKMEEEDPWAFQNHRMNFMQLQGQRKEIASELQTREQQRTEMSQHEVAKRLQETRTFAETNIKGWSPEVDAKVTNFAQSELGFDRDTLIEAYNPQVYHALYLAWVGHQTLNKPATPKKQPKPAGKPLNKVGSKSNPPARKALEEMSMEEYAAHMNRREAKKVKR